MKNIYKYILPIGLKPMIEMPFEAEIISVQMQNDEITMWAIINDDNSIVQREFYVLGTGHGFPEEVGYAIRAEAFKHHGTIQNGGLVWHIFENTMPF